jgi:hypothetical protein
MFLKPTAALFASSLIATGAYAQANSPTPGQSSNSSAQMGSGAVNNAQCNTNANLPEASANSGANAKCMVMQKKDSNGKIGPASTRTAGQPGSKPGPMSPR